MIHFSLLAALCVSANPDAGAAPPWQVGTPGSGVPGWPYVSQIPLGVKRFATLQEAIDAAPDKSTIELPSGVYGLPIKIQKRRGLKLVGLDGGEIGRASCRERVLQVV